jgi:hypothetical protein
MTLERKALICVAELRLLSHRCALTLYVNGEVVLAAVGGNMNATAICILLVSTLSKHIHNH